MNEYLDKWVGKELTKELEEGVINAPQDLLGCHVYEYEKPAVQIFVAYRPCAEAVWLLDKDGKEVRLVDLGDKITDEQRNRLPLIKKKKKKDLSPEEKEILEKEKKEQEEAAKLYNLLRAVSIRLPLLFYGADADITKIIHLNDFVNIVDDESWSEFMPTGLSKELFLDILKFYDEDVVVGAGLRIRRLAKAADELPPTIRAKRIVEILSKFKNPDKETVLTPWRVVNMHLGETLGGYNFYDSSIREFDNSRHYACVGLGYRSQSGFFFDLAFQMQCNRNSESYTLYNSYEGVDAPMLTESANNLRALMSIGIIF